MYARNNIYLSPKRTNLSNLTTVRTLLVFQYHLADCLFLILINCLTQNSKPFLVLCKCLLELFGNLTDIFFPYLLFVRKDSTFHLLGRNNLLNLRKHLLGNRTACIRMFFLSDFCHNLIDKRNDGLVNLMTLVDRLEHLFLRHFICTGFNHNYLLASRCHCKLQVAVFPLLLIWIYHEHAIDKPHLRCRTWTVKRDIRDRSDNRRAKHCDQLWTALWVNTHDHIVQGHIISVILWKQRAHRSVNHAACQDRILTCFALSLVKTSRNLSDRVKLLLILHRKREEINPISGFL